MQAVNAWKNLAKVWQQEDESLVDYYKRFMGMVEMVERTYGKVAPVVIAKKNPKYSMQASKILDEERDKMLTFLFMDGARKKQYGFLLKDLSNDCAVGNMNYPDSVEDGLQVLTLYAEKAWKH